MRTAPREDRLKGASHGERIVAMTDCRLDLPPWLRQRSVSLVAQFRQAGRMAPARRPPCGSAKPAKLRRLFDHPQPY
jgi:hypothetical protein